VRSLTRREHVLDVDLSGYDMYREGFPHDLFNCLRDEHPVWRHPTAYTKRSPNGLDFWVVLGHAEHQRVSRDWQQFSSLEGASITPTPKELEGHSVITADPPAHTRLRKLISAGFTPRMVRQLDDLVERRAAQVLDSAGALGTCNFVDDVAFQLPMHMIADIIGIPDADRPDVFHWNDVLTRGGDPDRGVSPEQADEARRSLFDYAAALGNEKRRHPVDDVWSILTFAEVDGEDGTPTSLSSVELNQFFFILTTAGSETTRSVISGGLVALLEHPEQMSLLRAHPELLPSAVEEMIRWVSPVTCFARTATSDLELDGQLIAGGERVSIWYPTANRDPRIFERPDEFDITRDPNPQISFGGGGAHFCLGAYLARREIRVMFEKLVARFPDIEIIAPLSYHVSAPEQVVAVALENVPVRMAPRR
jgi:cytochrome P450